MRGKWRAQRADRGAHAARGFVGGAASEKPRGGRRGSAVSMPHAALWVVQRLTPSGWMMRSSRFNAARGFVGGAAPFVPNTLHVFDVSMPHAALWVVQPAPRYCGKRGKTLFQCRTRLCGWCSGTDGEIHVTGDGFNAARGFVGGAASSLAALVPLRGKSPFGKSPEI